MGVHACLSLLVVSTVILELGAQDVLFVGGQARPKRRIPPPLGCSDGPPIYTCISVSSCSSSGPTYNNGDTCTYECAPGCSGPFTTTVTCNNGEWDGRVPICQSGGCKAAPPTPPCVNVICHSPAPYDNGQTCYYTCAPGCTGAVSTIVSCVYEEWKGQVPFCHNAQMQTCPSPPSFPCSTVSDCSAPYMNGVTCTYNCDDTCTGEPSTTFRRCLMGQWFGPDWDGCVPAMATIALHLGCDAAPPTFPCTARTCTGTTNHGDVCTYVCEDGCVGSPSTMTRTCTDGAWVGPDWGGCRKPEKPCRKKPKARPCSTYTCDQPGYPYPSGTTCTYTCRRGCATTPATTTATCRNGKWTGPNKRWKCKKGCGAPPDPPCTKRFGCDPAYKYGEKCYYRCYHEGGYAMEVSGDPVRICQKDGSWKGADLVCDCEGCVPTDGPAAGGD